MTRRLADTTTPARAPSGFDLYAGYSNGALIAPSYPGLVARFGPGRVFSISTNGNPTAVADIYDFENGDYTPSQAPAVRRNNPTSAFYSSRSDWDDIAGELARAGLALPRWWAATLDGTQHVLGAAAVQFADRGDYDESVIYDDTWQPQGAHMDPVVDVLCTGPAGCWQLTAGGAVNTIAGDFYGSPDGLPAGVQAGFSLPFRALTARVDGAAGYTAWDSDPGHRGYSFP